MDYDRPLLFVPNLRTEDADATSGYTWGKPASSSNILSRLPTESQASEAIVFVKNNNRVVSERWFCSDDPALGSLVLTEEGPKPFREILDADGPQILGPIHCLQFGSYLCSLMKQLDTNALLNKGSLSVQVHPKNGHPSRPARTEMWKGEGHVYIGWKEDMTADKLRQAYAAGTVEEYLMPADLEAERFILVEGGTVHAIRANSFLVEWSGAPGAEDLAKGNIADATVALWDRTDGKQPRPGKEDLEGAIDVLEHGKGLGAIHEEDIYQLPTMVQLDGEGNLLRKLFATRDIHVDEYTVTTMVTLLLEQGGLPLYVESGTLRLERDGELLAELPAGSECFLPYAMEQVDLRSVSGPTVVQMWYVPLEGVERRI